MKSGRILLLYMLLFAGTSLGVGQSLSQSPPEPFAAAQDVPGSECAGDGTGSGPSVPVGLCLPINDYLLPLFLCGTCLGSFYLLKGQKGDNPKDKIATAF